MQKKNVLLPLDNIFSIKNINQLELPNYDSLFKLKPKLISMKYLNPNYINCLRKYYGKNQDCANIKIIGKIDYNSAYINSSITDKNLGLLISGIMAEKDNKVETKLNKGNVSTALKNQINNKEMPKVTKDIEIKIMKESKKNKIYKKESDGDEPNEIKEIKMN